MMIWGSSVISHAPSRPATMSPIQPNERSVDEPFRDQADHGSDEEQNEQICEGHINLISVSSDR
jgi:hypothetical protein